MVYERAEAVVSNRGRIVASSHPSNGHDRFAGRSLAKFRVWAGRKERDSVMKHAIKMARLNQNVQNHHS